MRARDRTRKVSHDGLLCDGGTRLATTGAERRGSLPSRLTSESWNT